MPILLPATTSKNEKAAATATEAIAQNNPVTTRLLKAKARKELTNAAIAGTRPVGGAFYRPALQQAQYQLILSNALSLSLIIPHHPVT